MFAKIGHGILIVALLAATGAHWAVLQSVAWTAMLANNLQEQSLTLAVSQTFDGEHPCCLCKAIAAGKKSEKKTEFSIDLKKLEFISEKSAFVFNPPQDFCLLPEFAFSRHVLSTQPPVPPPRAV